MRANVNRPFCFSILEILDSLFCPQINFLLFVPSFFLIFFFRKPVWFDTSAKKLDLVFEWHKLTEFILLIKKYYIKNKNKFNRYRVYQGFRLFLGKRSELIILKPLLSTLELSEHLLRQLEKQA